MNENCFIENNSRKKVKNIFSRELNTNFHMFQKQIPFTNNIIKKSIKTLYLSGNLDSIKSEKNLKTGISKKTKNLIYSKLFNSYSLNSSTNISSNIIKNNYEDKINYRRKLKALIDEFQLNHKFHMEFEKKYGLDKIKKIRFRNKSSLGLTIKDNKTLFEDNIKLDENNKVNSKKRLINEPTNNIEMNKILINNFGLTRGITEMNIGYSKKLAKIGNKYLNILEEMKRKRTKIKLNNFNKLKKSLKNCEDYVPSKEEENILSNNIENIWEKTFFKGEYKSNRISNEEFKYFIKQQKSKEKKKIRSNSENFANIIMGINEDPYEIPDIRDNLFPSNRSNISKCNLKRVSSLIHRLKEERKYFNDGILNIKPELIKKVQKKHEDQLFLILRNLGPPKFLLNKFKKSTISQFKSAIGNGFGLPK